MDSSILNVSSGAEMSSHAPQLIEHFRTHGTPIMIGNLSEIVAQRSSYLNFAFI